MKVFVKFQNTYEEWEETYGGEVLTVLNEDSLKEDIKQYLSKAREYINGKLIYYRKQLNKLADNSHSMKVAMGTLTQSERENPDNYIVKTYNLTKREVSYCEQIIKKYKTAQKTDLETVKIYLLEERHIEYREYDV